MWGHGAHPGKNQDGSYPPWKYQPWSEIFQAVVCEQKYSGEQSGCPVLVSYVTNPGWAN